MNEQVFYLPKRAVLRNRYEVTSVIGTGGFGITYRAVDRLLECPVAVKEFFPQSWVSREAVTTYVVEFPEAREKRKLVEECLQNFRHRKHFPYSKALSTHWRNCTAWV